MNQNSNLSAKAQQDYKLVEAALKGKGEAFTKLLGKYKDTIYYMILRKVNNINDAEDLTFEAFSKAFKNLPNYSSEFAFSTWLFKIAQNNCIDFLRNKKESTVPLNIDIENNDNNPVIKLRSKDLDPEQRLIRIQRAILLRRIVGRLHTRYRTLIEYRYFNEYSYEEISKKMSLPLGTVKTQLFRARELLFKMIDLSEMKER